MRSAFDGIKRWWSEVENWLAGGLIIGAVIYAGGTRPVEQVLTYGPVGYVGFAMVLNAFGMFFVIKDRSHKPPNFRRISRAIALTSLAAVPFSLIYLSFVAVVVDMFQFALGRQQWSQRHWTATAAVATAALGAIFFWFRLRQRFIYGFSEALAGIAVATHRVSLEKTTGIPLDTGFYFAVLTAGIYLVVRGFDNMHQAAIKGDRVYAKLVAFGSGRPKIHPRRLRSFTSVRAQRARASLRGEVSQPLTAHSAGTSPSSPPHRSPA